MKKFLKIVWCLSVFIVFFFNLFFNGWRIFDYVQGNYAVEKMNVENYSYNSTSRRKSITIEGYIDNEKVYFSEFDKNIDKLYQLYPTIFSENENTTIEVLKFKNSHNLLLPSEFKDWKTELLLSVLYIVVSLLIYLSKK